MFEIIHKLFDYVFPPRYFYEEIKKETPTSFCRFLHLEKYGDCIVLANYGDDFVGNTIKANKFHNNEHASKLLAELIRVWFLNLPNKSTIFIPIPLSQERERKRGYNQVSNVLRVLKKEQILVIDENILRRTKDTLPQSSIGRKDRLQNMKDAFVIDNKDLSFLSGKRIILVDDVVTTGSTMRSALAVLKEKLPKNCEIICLAFAH